MIDEREDVFFESIISICLQIDQLIDRTLSIKKLNEKDKQDIEFLIKQLAFEVM